MEKKILERIFWQYRGRWESSKLGSTDPRDHFFRGISSDLWIVEIAAQMRDLRVPITASEKYELYSKPIYVSLSTRMLGMKYGPGYLLESLCENESRRDEYISRI